MSTRYRPDHPTEGPFPTLTYTYTPEQSLHSVKCSCGDSCATTIDLIARRFAASHTQEHAAHRIVTPQKEDN